MRNYDSWDVAKAVLPLADRVLLYGPPGTGKTHAGQHIGVKENDKVFSMYLTEYTPVTEPRGTIYPTLTADGERKFQWFDGPALEAYRKGGRLVINEIDKASDDTATFLLALLDDREVSKITLPTGEIVKPHPNFSVVATMNAEPSDLMDALRDRFPVTVRIEKPSKEAVDSLSEDLRKAALSTVTLPDERRVGLRQWLTYDVLRFELGPDMAAQACFGDQAQEVMNAFKMEETREEYTR